MSCSNIQRSDPGEAQTHNLSVPSQALYHCAPFILFLYSIIYSQAFSEECVTEKIFSYFSTKTYVVGTQKNRLIETVLLSTKNISLKLWVRKYLQFYAEEFCLSKLMIATLAMCKISKFVASCKV